jgi:hypothetical protein
MNIRVVLPPQLPSLAEIQSNTVIIGYDPITGNLVRITASQLLTGTGYPEWKPAPESYDLDEIVIYQLRFWKSLENGNEGNIPSEGAHWTEVSPTEVQVPDRWKGSWVWADNDNAEPSDWSEGDMGEGVGERFNQGDDGYAHDGALIIKMSYGFKYL